MRYDADGRRVSMTDSNGTDLGFIHAGDMEIADLDLEGGTYNGVLRRYIPGAATDERVALITVNPATGATIAREYYHANRLGSVIAMADETGAITAQYVYTPCGVESPYNASGNPFRYTGRRLDAQWGVYYYRARYYDPQLGRFLETDPAGYADSMNLYAYVGHDPLNGTDPTGKAAVTLGADVDFSIGGLSGGFTFGVPVSLAPSDTGNGLNFQFGGFAGGQVSGSVVDTFAPDASLVDRAKSAAGAIASNFGGGARGELGVFVGQDGNAAQVEDLGGGSVEVGGSISRKALTRGARHVLGDRVGAVLDSLPDTSISAELIDGGSNFEGNRIAGVQLGLGISAGPGGTTNDAIDTQVRVWVDEDF